MIQVNDLWKQYGRHDALRGLSFKVTEYRRENILFAWANVKPGQYENAEFLRQFEMEYT